MGCESYEAEGVTIRFSEGDSDVCCLCTFPHNDQKEILPHRLESFALLGAAVVFAKRTGSGGYIYLPEELPDWITEGIRSLVGQIP